MARRPPKKIVHVHQQVIKRNATTGSDDPPLIVRTYKGSQHAYEVLIKDQAGEVIAKVVNRMHDPDSCGARVWIETYTDVELITSRDDQGEVSDEPGYDGNHEITVDEEYGTGDSTYRAKAFCDCGWSQDHWEHDDEHDNSAVLAHAAAEQAGRDHRSES